jgi:hypothetical protein
MLVPTKEALKHDSEMSLLSYRYGMHYVSIFPYFTPDAIENITHDAPDDYNMTVFDANGLAVFGRQVENSKGNWYAHLKQHEYVKEVKA